MYTALEWLQILGFGAMLGAAGQLIRTIAGLKKLNEDAKNSQVSFSELFSASQMVVSVLIGGVAGMLGAISLGVNPTDQLPVDKLVALMGTGYAGADFIEAFMARPGPRVRAAEPLAAIATVTAAEPEVVVVPQKEAVVLPQKEAVG